jgi:hypothetical protein
MEAQKPDSYRSAHRHLVGALVCLSAFVLLAAAPPASETSVAADLEDLVVVPMDFDWHLCDSCLYRIQFFDAVVLVIPGSEDQDAGNIIASLVQLDGSFALCGQLVDVVTIDDIDVDECQFGTPLPDGHPDLVLEFDGRQVMDNNEQVMHLRGNTWDSEVFELDCCLPDRTPGTGRESTLSPARHARIIADSGGVFPNPFRTSTTICFTLNKPCYVEIRIFDLLGRTVHSLASSWIGTGDHAVVWDGCDYTGRRLQSGTYFYRMTVEGEAKAGMLVLLD